MGKKSGPALTDPSLTCCVNWLFGDHTRKSAEARTGRGQQGPLQAITRRSRKLDKDRLRLQNIMQACSNSERQKTLRHCSQQLSSGNAGWNHSFPHTPHLPSTDSSFSSLQNGSKERVPFSFTWSHLGKFKCAPQIKSIRVHDLHLNRSQLVG